MFATFGEGGAGDLDTLLLLAFFSVTLTSTLSLSPFVFSLSPLFLSMLPLDLSLPALDPTLLEALLLRLELPEELDDDPDELAELDLDPELLLADEELQANIKDMGEIV